jgi:hypothetical protein
MDFFKKHRMVIVFLLLEIVFYFRLGITDHQTYFFTWGIIGLAFFIFDMFNVIKANPILSLFNSNAKDPSVKQLAGSKKSFQSRVLNGKSYGFIFFIVTNFLLYLFV